MSRNDGAGAGVSAGDGAGIGQGTGLAESASTGEGTGPGERSGHVTSQTRPPPVRILVVDDHPLFRRGLTALLARDPRLQVAGDAADGGEALRRAAELRPDLILLDNHLPGVHGVDLLPALRDAAPEAQVLMLTVSEDEQDLAAAFRGGAAGYLLKTIEGEALVAAYREAASGAGNTQPVVAPAPPASPLDALSVREREILRGIARGASNKEIARELGIAETTVKIHVQHVLRKLGVASRVQAAVIATAHGQD